MCCSCNSEHNAFLFGALQRIRSGGDEERCEAEGVTLAAGEQSIFGPPLPPQCRFQGERTCARVYGVLEGNLGSNLNGV